MKDLHTEKYKTLLSEVKDLANRSMYFVHGFEDSILSSRSSIGNTGQMHEKE